MDARHLTDQQWLALMRAVPDGTEAIIRFPLEPGDVAAVRRDNTVTIIEPDGKTRTTPRITAE